MALSHEDRILRLTLLGSFLLAMAFLIPYGVCTWNPVPSIGLVPAGISGFTSLYHFSGKATNNMRFNLVLDTALAIFFLAMYIAATVTIADYWNRHLAILGVYGTMPLLMGFFIHTYIVLRDVNVLAIAKFHLSALFQTPQCPHCQRAVLSTWGMTSSRAPSDAASSRHSYAAVDNAPEGEEAPADYKDASPTRESVDETARLV